MFIKKEKTISTIIHNGKMIEKISKKENVNGNIKIENIVNKGILSNNGKLRKKRVSKHVSFSRVKEFIEPKYVVDVTPRNIEERTITPYYKPIRNKTMKKRMNENNGKKNGKKNKTYNKMKK